MEHNQKVPYIDGSKNLENLGSNKLRNSRQNLMVHDENSEAAKNLAMKDVFQK